MAPPKRQDRFYTSDRAGDNRGPFERDRDRILYSTALRRLGGVTQIASAAEGPVFHNRLTHTLEVAQIGRRLAERLIREFPAAGEQIDPDVVEAAALAHDLGHPPYGHVAEKTLDGILTKDHGIADGFEGNAQSFRIVTKLSVRHETLGLNLTRATLNAILKYPWLRQSAGDRSKKWGAYHTEKAEFEWARELYGGGDQKSVEAQIMDWADDVAYSVHDVDDFYRSGLIPLDRLVDDERERSRFLDYAFTRWRVTGKSSKYAETDLRTAFKRTVELVPLEEPFSGARRQRAALRAMTSNLISRYVGAEAVSLEEAGGQWNLVKEADAEQEISIWKEVAVYYVIRRPSLASQEHGQRQVVKALFDAFARAAHSGDFSIFPTGFREELESITGTTTEQTVARFRVVADLIASMTEKGAHDVYGRLTGASPGSILDSVLR